MSEVEHNKTFELYEVNESEVHIGSCKQEEETSVWEVNQLLSDIDIGDVSEDQRAVLHDLLERHKSVFSRYQYDVCLCRGVSHSIRTECDKPVKLPYRRIPPSQWAEVREYLKKGH